MKVAQHVPIEHVAGPWQRDHTQHCTRCGVVLKTLDVTDATFGDYLFPGAYPQGARVQTGPGCQAMVTGGLLPSQPCEPGAR